MNLLSFCLIELLSFRVVCTINSLTRAFQIVCCLGILLSPGLGPIRYAQAGSSAAGKPMNPTLNLTWRCCESVKLEQCAKDLSGAWELSKTNGTA